MIQLQTLRRSFLLAALVGTAALATSPAKADEGMWTFNRFPTETLFERHGFRPDAAWFDHVRLSSARLAQGCSASFVSGDGLVMTNHHCVHRCVEELSTPAKDLIKDGFYAKALKDERRCPNLEVNQLVSIEDVTARVQGAVKGLSDADANKARKAEMAAIEKACATTDDIRCDVVTLYDGGIYDLYTYRRIQDVRLVFAPELAIAFFGGDPDNFMFPRHDLDSAFIRVWDGDKPLKTPHHFKWSKAGTSENALTFVSGNPGRTSRGKTVAEVRGWRDHGLIRRLIWMAEMRGQLVEYARRGKEQARHSKHVLFGIENAFKNYHGESDALFAPGFVEALKTTEDGLRKRVAADPALAAAHLGAWDTIADAVARGRALGVRYSLLEGAQGYRSGLFSIARDLVRAAAERPKSNGDRLREYSDSRLPGLAQGLFSKAPIYKEFEIFRLTFGLTKLREELGVDDAAVKAILGDESPEQLATRLVKGTKLMDLKLRKRLYEGGAEAIAASKDPMIAFARLVDEPSRAIRKRVEDEVEAPAQKAHESIAAARFALDGTSTYPDATFSPRLSFGVVKGWTEGERVVTPFTTFGSAFERHTGSDPFALPKRWLTKRSSLVPTTPFNFCTNNDIIGGNSGSPVFNKDAEIVGLIFDGNIHSLGGDYGFDEALNRAVAVDARAIIHALTELYGAGALASELLGQ